MPNIEMTISELINHIGKPDLVRSFSKPIGKTCTGDFFLTWKKKQLDVNFSNNNENGLCNEDAHERVINMQSVIKSVIINKPDFYSFIEKSDHDASEYSWK
jgi:hypothetical protein